MKVLLRTTIPNLGQAGSVMDVSDAYARNFLFPKGQAVVATAQHVAKAATVQRHQASSQSQKKEQAAQTRVRLEQEPLHVTGRANDQGTLFAAIHESDVVASAKRSGFDLRGCQFELGHLKTVGTHSISVTWSDHETSKVQIIVSHA